MSACGHICVLGRSGGQTGATAQARDESPLIRGTLVVCWHLQRTRMLTCYGRSVLAHSGCCKKALTGSRWGRNGTFSWLCCKTLCSVRASQYGFDVCVEVMKFEGAGQGHAGPLADQPSVESKGCDSTPVCDHGHTHLSFRMPTLRTGGKQLPCLALYRSHLRGPEVDMGQRNTVHKANRAHGTCSPCGCACLLPAPAHLCGCIPCWPLRSWAPCWRRPLQRCAPRVAGTARHMVCQGFRGSSAWRHLAY